MSFILCVSSQHRDCRSGLPGSGGSPVMQTWDPDSRSEVNTDFFLTWDCFFSNLDCEDFIFSVTVRKGAREVVRDTGERSRSFTLMQFV